jgi:hypothetical protein
MNWTLLYETGWITSLVYSFIMGATITLPMVMKKYGATASWAGWSVLLVGSIIIQVFISGVFAFIWPVSAMSLLYNYLFDVPAEPS